MKVLATAILLAFVVVSALVKRELLGMDEENAKLSAGSHAPALVLDGVDGARVDLQEVAPRKKAVLVTFWATWCGPCRVEMPALEALYAKKRAAGLEILAVNEDRDREKVAAYLKDRALSFPLLIDPDGKVAEAYGVEGLPTTVLIDRKGQVVRVESGFAGDMEFTVDAELRKGSTDG